MMTIFTKQNLNVQPGNRLATSACALWGASSLLLGFALLTSREQNILHYIGIAGAIGYIMTLIAVLLRRPPHAAELPDFAPIAPFPKKYGSMFTLVTAFCGGLFFITGILWRNGWLMLYFCFAIALLLIILFRKEMTRRMIAGGVLAGGALFLVEQLLGFNIGQALYLSVGIIPFGIAGLWLLERSRLSDFHLLNGDYRHAMKSVAWGCALAIPPALLNVAMAVGSDASDFDLLFDRWWKAFYALQPGILEEVWARLFVTTLLYALLRPLGGARPKQAMMAVVLMATFLHGMAHYPVSISDPLSAVFISLVYGIPLTLLYIKRDFEHAVAYHFLIDFVRFAVAALC